MASQLYVDLVPVEEHIFTRGLSLLIDKLKPQVSFEMILFINILHRKKDGLNQELF